MTGSCKECDTPLDDQDILAAGMEEICYHCWNERYEENRLKELSKESDIIHDKCKHLINGLEDLHNCLQNEKLKEGCDIALDRLKKIKLEISIEIMREFHNFSRKWKKYGDNNEKTE